MPSIQPDTTLINLNAIEYSRAETVIVKSGGMTASAFVYASGVKALRISNADGEMILLPFHGQQIWDATFFGRRLTMRSMFDDPIDTTTYLANYGAFLLHCGATAMGNPGAEDHHPLHGELPNARFQEAELIVGHDAAGAYMAMTGSYRHTVAFSHNYRARPMIRLNATGGRIGMSLQVHNLKNTPMDFMYLAHVNFRPVDGAMLVDTAPDDPKHVRVRATVPGFFKPSAAHRDLIAALQTNPALHRKMEASRAIDPELVMGMDFKSDASGWAHSLQLMPDGSADFISHKPTELGRGVRWITRTADQDALGLFLPGTAEADGYHAEKAKGNVLSIAPGATYDIHLAFGALNAKEASEMQEKIGKVMRG